MHYQQVYTINSMPYVLSSYVPDSRRENRLNFRTAIAMESRKHNIELLVEKTKDNKENTACLYSILNLTALKK